MSEHRKARAGNPPGGRSAALDRASPPPPGETSHSPAHSHPASSRLEAFSDAVFAFAATLLVVSLEVPHTYAELVERLWGFFAFGLSFLALALLWSTHHAFFRRHPMADRTTVALNALLLFVILFYVYPLKFVTVTLAENVMHRSATASHAAFRGERDVAGMFVVYGIGFVAVFTCLSLLHGHAARRSPAMGLGAESIARARLLQRHYLLFAVVGLLSIATAMAGIGLRYGVPGAVYAAIGPLAWAHWRWSAGRDARLSRR